MILPLDLTDMSKHQDLVQKVIKQYTRVSSQLQNSSSSKNNDYNNIMSYSD